MKSRTWSPSARTLIICGKEKTQNINVEKIKELKSLHKVKFNQFIRYQNLYSDSPTHDWYENYVIIFIAFSIAALIIIAIVKILLKKNSRHRRK